eukprot:gb/GEZN01004617.1/.p1 GENE.gb/GEZN01004617.1/~~gb/GEZN01004617.1/.p1  ORF type:complete len:572 (-),score=78.20 gb/GEZN01004617.1/:142-1857(-)
MRLMSNPRIRLRIARYSNGLASAVPNPSCSSLLCTASQPEGTGGNILFQSDAQGVLAPQLIKQFEDGFRNSPKNEFAQNIVTRHALAEIAVKRDAWLKNDHVFSLKLEKEGKVTSQSASGRCWLFAALNVMRLPFIKAYKLDSDFEFSQSYLFFWDKFEKANFFLEAMLETADLPVDGRLVSYLLKTPIPDGGQWDMVVNVIKKHGIVPKKCFPETTHSSSSRPMNWLLSYRLREFAQQLRQMCEAKQPLPEIRKAKQDMLEEIYRILCICLGTPPERFDWTYYSKDKKYKALRNLTPLSFFKEHVKCDVTNYVSLINDPRNEYYRCYTVDYLGNMVGGRPVLYINVPVEVLKAQTKQQLEKGKAVWFGCDVGKFIHRDKQLMDTELFDYSQLFGSSMNMSKADRLRYRESSMTHAMVFTGVDIYPDSMEAEAASASSPTEAVESEAVSAAPTAPEPTEPTTESLASPLQKEDTQADEEEDDGTGEDESKQAPKAKKKIIPQRGKIIKWRVENSWGEKKGDKGYATMTDAWFDEYMYQVVLEVEGLPEEIQQVLTQTPIRLPAWDPMGNLA